MKDKKGQGLSLNVIIIAALALVVLVVLIMVFTGRINIFQQEVGAAGEAEVVKMKIQYGQCAPTATAEASFVTEFGQADTPEAKESAKASYIDNEISRCKAFSDGETDCVNNGCRWK